MWSEDEWRTGGMKSGVYTGMDNGRRAYDISNRA